MPALRVNTRSQKNLSLLIDFVRNPRYNCINTVHTVGRRVFRDCH